MSSKDIENYIISHLDFDSEEFNEDEFDEIIKSNLEE